MTCNGEPNAFIIGIRCDMEAYFDEAESKGCGVGIEPESMARAFRSQDDALRFICDSGRHDMRVYGVRLPSGWDFDVTETPFGDFIHTYSEVVRLRDPFQTEGRD